MRKALIAVAKQPSVGQTKTRLTPMLSHEEATALYRSLLLDTLHLMLQVPDVQPVIAYTPPDGEPFFRSIAPPAFHLTPQVGNDLGARLHHVLRLYLRGGYTQAVVLDSDSPTLPVARLAQAFRALDDPGTDAVFGPCDDGGYYLVGLKAPCAALFQGMLMSTPTVLTETLERARAQALRVALLPVWYDVDTPHDLARLRKDLARLPSAIAPHTRRFLAQEGRPTPPEQPYTPVF